MIQIHLVDNDNFIVNVKCSNIIKDLQNLEDLFDVSNLNKNFKVFSMKNKKVFGKFEMKTAKVFWIDEFNCLGSKAYCFKCGSDSNINFQAVAKSQSKNLDLRNILIVYKKKTSKRM